MKLIKGLLVVSLSIGAVWVQAQPTTKKDTVAMLYENYLKLMESNQKVGSKVETLDKSILQIDTKVSEGLGSIEGKLNTLGNNLTTSLEQVNRLTENDVLSKQSRVETSKGKIVNTAVFVGLANNSFDAIDAALAQSDYFTDVAGLNNPSNTELGFSLSEEITKLLESKIIKGNQKFNNKNVGKFLSVVQNIIKDPFVASVTSTVPALSAIQGVLSLVTNVIIKEPGVSEKDYEAFKRELERYILHYDGLARANNNFNSNIENLKMRLEALRSVMNNYTLTRIRAVYPNAELTATMPLHKAIATYYAPLDLERNIGEIINSYRKGRGEVDYNALLSDERLNYPFYAINQAQFIKQELETLTNEYISSHRNYHKAIHATLLKSKGISKDASKIDKKLDDLNTKLEKVVSTFEKNVKIEQVVNSLNNIPTY